jgi:gamma-glutamyl-gamma-aminobutyrate hydrolase PuuD
LDLDLVSKGEDRLKTSCGCGIIEAFSNEKKKILGVQFHPELDLQNSDMQKVIELWLEYFKF